MRNFLIFFSGKEGTSPLVRLLNNVKQISIVHQVNNLGWEPFDKHNCGPMPVQDMGRCLEMIFNHQPTNFDELNKIYTKTATRPLEEFNESGSIGLKMRFHAPFEKTSFMDVCWPWYRVYRKSLNLSFRRMMFDLIKRNNLVVFMAVRQDVLRWALSRYHGDGTGNPGNLQFKLSDGEIKKEDIKKIYVDCNRLSKIIKNGLESHAQKRKLFDRFKRNGIQVFPLCYEDFLLDKQKYFNRVFELLELKVPKEERDIALNKGAHFKKVHSNDLSGFVENHQEVMDRFGKCFVSWA